MQLDEMVPGCEDAPADPRAAAQSSPWSIDIGHDRLPPVSRLPGQLTVLDVTKWFGNTSGGVRTYLEQKSAYVASRPWLRHVLVIPSDRDVIEDRPMARWYRLRGPRIPSQPQYRFLLAARSLRRIVEHERPDVIEVGSPVFVPWIATLAARGTRIPIVSFYHTNLLTRSRSARWPGRLHDNLLRAYARRIDRLFATTLVASGAAESDLWSAGLHRTTRVTLGVDIAMFNPSRRTTASMIRAMHGVREGRRMIVYAGRLAREKSLEIAVEAFRDPRLQSRADLVIVGDGPLGLELRERARGLPIHFAPFESNRRRLADLLAASDVYLAPGSRETFGLSSLEAMACGTPVVTADAGGVAELVSRAGVGRLFRSGDAESLAKQLNAVLDESSETMAIATRDFVEREHSWEVAFDRLFDAYRSVLAA
ncbi:MAG TPA: glycosyltransferase [Gemmatimonadaceae bacterium]|jgi:alpha-1,6-mannosyltransferase